MASESTHAPSIDARGMARDMILFEHQDAAPGSRKMQRRGAAMQAAATLDRTFHALSDPTRRAMVQRLSRGPASV